MRRVYLASRLQDQDRAIHFKNEGFGRRWAWLSLLLCERRCRDPFNGDSMTLPPSGSGVSTAVQDDSLD